MPIAHTYSALLTGLEATRISVEVDISNGLHSFSIVGLGDRAVDEAKDRISAAIKNSGFASPKQKNQKVVISLAPAHIRKEGTMYDLPMAIAYLKASGDIAAAIDNVVFIGELSLSGHVRGVKGILPILCSHELMSQDYRIFVPRDNDYEARLSKNPSVVLVSSLTEVIARLNGEPVHFDVRDSTLTTTTANHDAPRNNIREVASIDMSLIKGNSQAKRGLEIAAVGSHNVMMYGPKGTGKTMLAKGFHGILPDLSHDHVREAASILSLVGSAALIENNRPPFRSPHHTASYPAMIGGGTVPRPGEITLAHRGVLFMDEFPEFDREVIESLRQPLEDKVVSVARARGTVTFPADCMMIATMNPCPCGEGVELCKCSEKSVSKYREKVSGPIADRIDIWLNVDKIDYEKLGDKESQEESSEIIRRRVEEAQTFSESRRRKRANAGDSRNQFHTVDDMDDDAIFTLKNAAATLRLSARGFNRTMKVARTIADMDRKEKVGRAHVLEALIYRKRF